MPIKFDGRTFKHFRNAVRYVVRKKGWGEERARRYVGGIEKNQVKYKGRK